MLLTQWTQASVCSSCVGHSVQDAWRKRGVWHSDHYRMLLLLGLQLLGASVGMMTGQGRDLA